MRRLALLLLLLSVLSASILASCGATPAPLVAPLAMGPAATPTRSLAGTSWPPPTHSITATPQPSDTPSPTLSPTSTPTRAPTLTPSATPTLPPLLASPAGKPLALSLGWQFDANGHLTTGHRASLSGRPAFLLSSLGRTVYALTEGGKVLWRAGMSSPVYALAVLHGERVAVGDDAGYVTLLDAHGQRIWRRDLSALTTSSPGGSRVTALCGDWQGGLLAGGWDGSLTFFSSDGELRWQVDLGSPVSGIAALPNLALVATSDAAQGRVQAFDPTGAQVWRFDAGAPVTSLGIVGPAYILAGLQDGRLLAVDAEGALRWQQTFSVESGSPVWHAADVTGDDAPEIIAGTGGEAPLLALLSAEGEVVWRIPLPAAVGAITALDLDGDGTVEIVAGLSSGEIQVYGGQGRYRASVYAGLSVWGLEAADDGSAGLTTAGTVLVLADVVAWQLRGETGPGGRLWLTPPAMMPVWSGLPPGTERAEGEAILTFLGDVSPGRSMEAQLARYGPAHPWEGLGPLLHEADLAVANLESVLTARGRPLDKPYLIRAHPRWGQTLVEGGFDLATLANNHVLDYGQEGLDDTLDTLQALGIATVGAGRSQKEAHRPALFTVKGVRLAVLAYAAARWNSSVDVPATDRIAWAEPAAVQADVRAVRDQADVVVVVLHSGTEYAAKPSPNQVAVAHAAIDAGADLVVGHHPHVTQTVERYRQGLIVYSLGDALFDIPRPAAMQGDLLRVHITKAGLVQAELWPFWIEDAIRPRLLDDGQGGPQVKIVYP
jgi:poly-gamma-glutamate capsule biosynthesis protein CapA/YwtB (metallophosphatase superfamily)/outer membrane protein assembly factor BamB